MKAPDQETTDPATGLAATVALGSSAALLGFLVLLAPVHALVPEVALPAPLEPHHQTAETLLYVLAFAVLLPAAAFTALTVTGRVLAGPNREAVEPLAAVSVLAAAGVLVVTRIAGPDGDLLGTQAALALVATAILGALWIRAAGSSWSLAGRLRAHASTLAAAGALAVLAAVVSLGYPSHIDIPWLVAALAATGVACLLFSRGWTVPRVRRPWGWAVDGLVLILVLAAVPDLVIYQGIGEANQPGSPFLTYVTGFHQALYLGAASQIMDGSALLVDTVSQYGVASIYLIAAFFQIAPIGNGTLGFFDASLTALTFGAGYLILRLVGAARIFAAATMAFAVVVLVWALEYPLGALLQHGGLRFGLPMALVLFWTAAARYPQARRWLRGAGWAIVAVSSVWALEAFMYTTGALAGMVAIEAALRPQGRLRWLFRQVVFALAAWVAGQLLFAVATLVWAGSLPDWGLYLTYLRDFLAGDVGDLTYDVPAWSPGLTVGFASLVSALAALTVALRRPDIFRDRPVAAIALAGLAGYGIVLYSYFDNRSLAHVIPYISLPVVLGVAVWLWLVISHPGVSRRLATASLASVLILASVALATAMPGAGQRAETSLLVSALPGGNPLRASFERLWDPPEIVPGGQKGAELLAQYMPDQDATPVIAVPDLDNNVLTLAGRANALAITDAKEQSWVPGPHVDRVEESATALEQGDRLLMDTSALVAYRALRLGATPEELAEDTDLALIQLLALQVLAERFRLEVVASRGKFRVVELVEPGGRSGNVLAGGQDPVPVQDQPEAGP